MKQRIPAGALVIFPERYRLIERSLDRRSLNCSASICWLIYLCEDHFVLLDCVRSSRGFGRCFGGRTTISARVRRLAVLMRALHEAWRLYHILASIYVTKGSRRLLLLPEYCISFYNTAIVTVSSHDQELASNFDPSRASSSARFDFVDLLVGQRPL